MKKILSSIKLYLLYFALSPMRSALCIFALSLNRIIASSFSSLSSLRYALRFPLTAFCIIASCLPAGRHRSSRSLTKHPVPSTQHLFTHSLIHAFMHSRHPAPSTQYPSPGNYNVRRSLVRRRIAFSLLLFAFCLLPFSAFSQSHNLVTVTVPRVPYTDTAALAAATPGEIAQTVTSYDGLGRVTQKIQVAASPGKKDLVTAFTYDLAGRREKEYLPYVREPAAKGHVSPDPLEELQTFYHRPPAGIDTTTWPYARKVFDGSPLNRVLQQGAPGRAWQPERGHAVAFNNTVNAEPVTRWQVGKEGDCSPAGSYAPGSLLVKEVRDEDGHLSREYTDKRGRVILKETLLDSVPVQTFYVYDDRNLLRVVIPPMAAALGRADDRYVFRYSYDARRRMITKKIPGAEKVEMVYDNRDRLVMSRDGNLRHDTLWRYTFYDAFGRVTQQGFCRTTAARAELQQIFDRQQTPPVSAPALPGTLLPQQYSYYDDYAFLRDTSLAFRESDLGNEDLAAYPEPF